MANFVNEGQGCVGPIFRCEVSWLIFIDKHITAKAACAGVHCVARRIRLDVVAEGQGLERINLLGLNKTEVDQGGDVLKTGFGRKLLGVREGQKAIGISGVAFDVARESGGKNIAVLSLLPKEACKVLATGIVRQ